jgi:hypothetical protein
VVLGSASGKTGYYGQNQSYKEGLVNEYEEKYLHLFICFSKLIEEQKAKENNHKNILFVTAIEYADTPLLNHVHAYKVLTNPQYHRTSACYNISDHYGPPEHTHAALEVWQSVIFLN